MRISYPPDMKHSPNLLISAVFPLLAAILLGACAKEEDVRVYEVIVPPGTGTPVKPIGPMTASPATGAAAASQSAAVRWKIADDWQPQALTDMINRGHFLLPEAAGSRPVLTISAYPGEAGGLASNVNRWRRQLGLAEDPAVAAALQQITVGSHSIETCYFEGKKPDGSAAAMAGGVLSLPGETWFFKLTGTKDAVDSARPAFETFLKSLEIGGSGEAPAPASTSTPAVEAKPKFSAPATWKELPPSGMRAAGFRIAGPDGIDAEVSVVKLSGGSDLQNVNMWNQQLNLPDIDEAGMAQAAPTEILGPHSARIFDRSTTGKVINDAFRGRIIAAIIRHNDQVWIVRIKGEHNHLEMEKANFRAFLGTLSIP